MNVPEHLRYTADHEWVSEEGGRIRIGVTDFAQDALGDVVYVQLPVVGATLEAGATCSEVESTKSVSDVYAPVAGEIIEVNDSLVDAPQRLNEDPYGQGWICVMAPSDAAAVGGLLDAAEYSRLIAGQ